MGREGGGPLLDEMLQLLPCLSPEELECGSPTEAYTGVSIAPCESDFGMYDD